jgi:hypothetical protein
MHALSVLRRNEHFIVFMEYVKEQGVELQHQQDTSQDTVLLFRAQGGRQVVNDIVNKVANADAALEKMR